MIAITDILSLLAIAQTGFTIIYLLTHRQNRTQDRLIALLLLFLCMPPIMKTIVDHLESGTPGVLVRLRGFGFMFGPLLYLAIHARLHGDRKRKLPRWWFLHFLPGIVLETILLWKGYLLPPRPAFIMEPVPPRPPHWFGLLYSGTMIISAIGYSIWSLIWIQSIQSRYRELTDPAAVHPLLGSTKAMVYAVLVVFVLMLLTGLAHNVLREPIGWPHAVTFLLGIYTVSFLAIRWSMRKLPAAIGDIADHSSPPLSLHTTLPTPANRSSESRVDSVSLSNGKPIEDSIDSVEPDDSDSGSHPETGLTRYSRTGLNSQEAKLLAERVTEYMQTNRPYLNDEFSLDDLKAALNVPRHHISQVINDIFGRNFYAYVNDYRVAEACRLLRSPDYRDHPVARIGMECGFVSRSVFYEVFRKKLGTTPAAYRQNKNNTG
ncbi:MAG: helix-turn-helix transcriptional regulator [Leptospiraceae bacterium]|nr:helix-turn-helix transcriptional regulator [Leptospiraceae bacterium]